MVQNGALLGLGHRLDGQLGEGAIGRDVYRLRDLEGWQRWVVAGVALALSLAPALALVRYAPDWFPAGDPALMGLRALDVGTSRTALIGQPSLSGIYVDGALVHHLGAVHFYLMAPFVRLLGVPHGMLLVSVLITGGCLLTAAWVSFRQLGLAGGVVAAVVLAAITFTTGASSLVNPVSSNIAGYPFLCSMFLLWALLCGDVRLLPLAAAMVSFTALQHLSVLPALVTATVAGLAGLAVVFGRRPREERPSLRELAVPLGVTGVVGLAMWLPVMFQELFGDRPNLSALADFTGSSDRPSLGFGTALRHVVHVLGLPPLLGQTDARGAWLFGRLAWGTWLSAGVVVAVLAFVGWRWRRRHPRRSALVVMAAAVALAGVVGSATVPVGHEQDRLVFYHWVFPLAGFVALAFGLLAVDALRGLAARRAQLRPAAFGVAIAAIAVVNLVNPFLDRWSNSLQAAYAPFDRDALDELADQVLEHRDHLRGEVVLIAREPAFGAGLDPAVAVELEERGLALRHPRYQGVFVDEQRLAHRPTVDAGLVLLLDTPTFNGRPEPPDGGELIADVEVRDGIVLLAHFDHNLARPEPAHLKVYLLERDELLDWAKRRELVP